jgi:predicted ATPase/class 3 adenylate cyclase
VTELPSGTVTLLFTDIAGSTRLLHELGAGYATALEEHRRILREAFAKRGGVEVDTQGDAFFIAFARAEDAVAAAREAQAALAGGRVRVRMGLHTGEPLLTQAGYIGIDVHRAARIAAAGHGGQVLISQSTRALLGGDGLRDLGEHRLKDLAAPERIYQVGGDDFPPLKSLHRTNLPIAAWPLVGRTTELAALEELIRSRIRLITITGPGGTGKTRLALQAAAELLEDFRDGVFWVPLAHLRDAALLPSAIAQSLGLAQEGGATSSAVGEYLRGREVLLVIDNAEHLPELAHALARLLSDLRDSCVLVTSRSPLHLAVEREYALDPLEIADAVELFATQARNVRRDFEVDDSVEMICRRLDGLPLAIELAAARAKTISARAILDRLEHRLPLLTGGPRDNPQRQQTLRATIDWSYELLDTREQKLFRDFSVFAGGADIATAGAVCDAELDHLESLVDKSLLKPLGDARFMMLETIREYAHERLAECGDLEAQNDRHAQAYLEVAERANNELWSTGRAQWLTRLAADDGNLLAAMSRFLGRGEIESAARLAGALWLFWTLTGFITEGRRVLLEVLRHESELAPAVLAPVLHGAGHLSWNEGRYDEARALVERGSAIFRQLGDRERLAWAIMSLGAIAWIQGDAKVAEATYAEALELFRSVGANRGVAYGLNDLGLIALEQRDLVHAKALLEESERLCRSVGDAWGHANALAGLADVTLEIGDVPQAESLYRTALAGFREIASRSGCAECLEGLAVAAADRGDAARAVRLAGAAATMREASGALPTPNFASRYAHRRDRAKAELGPEQSRVEWDRGRSTGTEEAIAYALEADV